MNENAVQDKADVDDVDGIDLDPEAGRGRYYLLAKTLAGRIVCAGPMDSEDSAAELGLKMRSYSIYRIATRDLGEAKRRIKTGTAMEVASL
ncbi:MAG: hypothetical protein Q7J84_12590 [Sulfuricaulis sp.]|nr:hypothetical protein [Sulfuricaulis sp.]